MQKYIPEVLIDWMISQKYQTHLPLQIFFLQAVHVHNCSPTRERFKSSEDEGDGEKFAVF